MIDKEPETLAQRLQRPEYLRAFIEEIQADERASAITAERERIVRLLEKEVASLRRKEAELRESRAHGADVMSVAYAAEKFDAFARRLRAEEPLVNAEIVSIELVDVLVAWRELPEEERRKPEKWVTFSSNRNAGKAALDVLRAAAKR
jgi:hypothetical protein